VLHQRKNAPGAGRTSTRVPLSARAAVPSWSRPAAPASALAARRPSGRPAEPVLPLPPGVPPAARWAGARRPWTGSVRPRGGAAPRSGLWGCAPGAGIEPNCRATSPAALRRRKRQHARAAVPRGLGWRHLLLQLQPGTTVGRPAKPVLPFPGIRPAARWAAGMGPRAGSVRPRDRAARSDAFGGVVLALGLSRIAGRLHQTPSAPKAPGRAGRSSALVSAGGGGFLDRYPAPLPAATPAPSCRVPPRGAVGGGTATAGRERPAARWHRPPRRF